MRKSAELSEGEDKTPKERPLSELLLIYHDQTLKRATRILNPLDDHPFMSMIHDEPERQTFDDSPLVLGEEFSRTVGYYDAQRMVDAEKAYPGFAKVVSVDRAELGFNHLSAITPKWRGEYEARAHVNKFFRGGTQQQSNPIRYRDDPRVQSTIALLDQVLREELFRAIPDTEGDFVDVYDKEEKKALFATAVGFAQAVVVGELEVAKGDKRRTMVRDSLLLQSFRVLTDEGHSELADYFVAQKTYQAFA